MKHPKKLNLKLEELNMRLWNAAHPVGTKVTLRLDDGTLIETFTDSAAWLIGHGAAVMSVNATRGGWALDRVTPVARKEEIR